MEANDHCLFHLGNPRAHKQCSLLAPLRPNGEFGWGGVAESSGGYLTPFPPAPESQVVVMMRQSPQATYSVRTPPQPPWGVGWGGVAEDSRSPGATPADGGAISRSRRNQQQEDPGMHVTAIQLSRSVVDYGPNIHRCRASFTVRGRKDTYRTFTAERLLRAAAGVCVFGKLPHRETSATRINDNDDDVETLFD